MQVRIGPWKSLGSSKTKKDKAWQNQGLLLPFKLARRGDEHYGTPEDSVYNIAFYTNWALSKMLLQIYLQVGWRHGAAQGSA